MADSTITDLTNLTSAAADDRLPIVDRSDTTMSPNGTTKDIAVSDLATAITSAGSLATDTEVASAISALSTVYQPLDSDLTAIAALSTTSFGRGLLVLADASAGRTALGLVIGTDVAAQSSLASYQPLDSDLTAIAALTTTSFGRSLLALADAAAARTALGLVIGTDVQAQDAELAAIAGLTSAADRLPYFTGSGTASLATFTSAGRALVDDADASAQRTTLGLATIAASGSASDLTSGTVATARLGSGTADSSTFLRGDNTWATPAGGGGGTFVAKVKTANETVNNSAVLQDDDDLWFAIAANETWTAVFGLAYQTASSVHDISAEITVPSGASLAYWAHGRRAADRVMEATAAFAAATAFTINCTASGAGTDGTNIYVTVRNGSTAGNVRFRWAQTTAVSADTTILAGSFVTAWKV